MRTVLLLLLACVPALATGCASAGDSAADPGSYEPVRITFRQYKNGVVFELVNEAHTDRVELYSQVRETADRKVTTDEVADELLHHFDDLHWKRYAAPGPAPESLEGALFALEVERDGQIEHVIEHAGEETATRTDLRLMIQGFLNIYNATWGAQAMKVEPGEDPFKRPER